MKVVQWLIKEVFMQPKSKENVLTQNDVKIFETKNFDLSFLTTDGLKIALEGQSIFGVSSL